MLALWIILGSLGVGLIGARACLSYDARRGEYVTKEEKKNTHDAMAFIVFFWPVILPVSIIYWTCKLLVAKPPHPKEVKKKHLEEKLKQAEEAKKRELAEKDRKIKALENQKDELHEYRITNDPDYAKVFGDNNQLN